ncbi:MAG: hypothetical protein ACRDRW_20365 [Pseudonocardiaceae bacterium]
MDKKPKVVHEVKIVRRGSVEGVKNQAICTCGWKGNPWTMLALAEYDSEGHLREYAD